MHAKLVLNKSLALLFTPIGKYCVAKDSTHLGLQALTATHKCFTTDKKKKKSHYRTVASATDALVGTHALEKLDTSKSSCKHIIEQHLFRGPCPFP